MKFIKTWRWFGPDDPVQLSHIRQMEVEGIVTSLLQFPVGEVWPAEAIAERKAMIEAAGFPHGWEVVESVNVHDGIKSGRPERDQFIEKYKKTLQNLGKAGIKIVCYNFMPVLDWVRTHYHYRLPDGRETIYFDFIQLAAFDLFILKRDGAEQDYSPEIKEEAALVFQQLNSSEKERLQHTLMGVLPGTSQTISLNDFRNALAKYQYVDADQMRENLYFFLRQIIPVAEAEGIKMAIHPDDPPFSVLGLPRIVSTLVDLKAIIEMVDSPGNGITFCSGSLGARPGNDVTTIAKEIAHRINFIHLRNVQHLEHGSFMEANHLQGAVNMPAVMQELIKEQQCRANESRSDIDIPLRPDHGFRMLDDFNRDTYPGYASIGRLKALAQLEGLEMGLRTKRTNSNNISKYE